MKLIYVILLPVLLCIAGNVSAGDTEKIKLENIIGSATGSEDESVKIVRERAINNAKIEAIRKAGISENINSYSNMFKNEISNNYEEMFTSNVFSSIKGEVTEIVIVKEDKMFSPEGAPKVTVTMNCTVIKYNVDVDMTFEAEVEGIEKFYKNDGGLIIKVKPLQDCYIRIFMISNKSESNMLYPSEHEVNRMLTKDVEVTFPDQSLFDNYTLSTEFDEEVYRLILVFLKKDIPFMDVSKQKQLEDKQGLKLLSEVTFKTVSDWIFKIPPDQRVVKMFPITVVK